MDTDEKKRGEGSQHFFEGAHHFGVRQITYIGNYFADSQSNMDLLPILDASHTRNRRTSPPDSNCLPGTQQKVLEDIRAWVEDDNVTEANHIFWLCGPVGCGKSAISQAVSEEFDAKGRLVGSFFFFRGSGDRSRISRMAVTLAAQMAEALPKTAPLVEATLAKPFGLQGASITAQFQQLIWSPLRAVFFCWWRKGPFLVVIDGLDECEDHESVEEFTAQLLDFFKQNPRFPLRFLLASRVEEHIRKRISRVEVRLENLKDHLPEGDILKVVRHSFKEAAEFDRIIRSHGGSWPSEEDVGLLIKHANGSFIFIRTLLNFILGLRVQYHDGLTPMDRFKLALGMHPGLDGLYTETLQRAQHIPEFQDVILTISLLVQPLSISLLSQLLGMPRARVVNVLIPLQSIIYVPGDDDTDVTLFHTSLRDFMIDEQRSIQLFPLGTLQNQKDRLAYRCLQHAVKLAIDDFRHITEPLTYIEHQWSYYWRQLGQQRMKGHCQFLFGLAVSAPKTHIRNGLGVLPGKSPRCPGGDGPLPA
ncbi:hypothetical protein FA13DRAFT_1816105 [Coprinellus micaceus]|uniref:Nephrocystin 3-like N-terminal domain-containing protein n=1 Tax=Coprinellus micaceus TaxID=71717 RepID=A0A4Y7T1Q4_COPMI|nr:hypothetical protein FA13DRAFT_1816105 [Coprinellus micaceus]